MHFLLWLLCTCLKVYYARRSARASSIWKFGANSESSLHAPYTQSLQKQFTHQPFPIATTCDNGPGARFWRNNWCWGALVCCACQPCLFVTSWFDQNKRVKFKLKTSSPHVLNETLWHQLNAIIPKQLFLAASSCVCWSTPIFIKSCIVDGNSIFRYLALSSVSIIAAIEITWFDNVWCFCRGWTYKSVAQASMWKEQRSGMDMGNNPHIHISWNCHILWWTI